MRPTMYLLRKGANGAIEDSRARANPREWLVVRRHYSASVQVQVDGTFDFTEQPNLTMRDPKSRARDKNQKGRTDKTAEGACNRSLASSAGCTLLDKELVVLSQYERLRIAGLLTTDGELLCVNAASSSAMLSRLSPGTYLCSRPVETRFPALEQRFTVTSGQQWNGLACIDLAA